MYLSEVPKTDKIIISFDIRDKHFDFTTDLLPFVDSEDPENTVYSAPIVIMGNRLHLDSRCKNMMVRYLNQLSGRLHVWKNISLSYTKRPEPGYIIKGQGDSIPVNRRHSIRIPVNYKSACTISLIDGKYPCVVNDISITGVGINIGSDLAEKNVIHRQIYTEFEDELLKKRFYLKANILHTFRLDASTVRCGCEIINITPSINEYINIKQTHSLAKVANYSAIINGDLNAILTDASDLILKSSAEAAFNDVPEDDANGGALPAPAPDQKSTGTLKEGRTAPVTELKYTPSPLKAKTAGDSYWLKDGGVCPVCEQGFLTFMEDAYHCNNCGSILE